MIPSLPVSPSLHVKSLILGERINEHKETRHYLNLIGQFDRGSWKLSGVLIRAWCLAYTLFKGLVFSGIYRHNASRIASSFSQKNMPDSV